MAVDSSVAGIYMTGAEWFRDRPGGLNRYFGDLYDAMTTFQPGAVRAVAFGTPPSFGESWGPVPAPISSRLRSLRHVPLGPGTVVDRHFALYGPPAGKNRDAVYLQHFQGPWFMESRVAGQTRLKVAAKFMIENRRYSHVDAFVVLCERFADLLSSEFGVSPDLIHVIPPGVDLERFNARDVVSGRPRVLCVRRLENRMGIHVLIDGWQEVLRKHPDAILEIVGTGSAETNLKERARRVAPQSVVFRGRLSDAELADAYATAHVTVVPSVALEGFGLIALESLASGRSPIVTDCGGLPDAVRDYDPSLIVPPGDALALASRICRALDGELPSVDEARRQAERFGWRKIADRHFELYSALVQKKSK